MQEIKETKKATVDLNSFCSYKSKFVELILSLPTGLLWRSIFPKKKKKM